jgi:hypothetical protein
MSNQIERPYKATYKAELLYILIFNKGPMKKSGPDFKYPAIDNEVKSLTLK